MGYLPPARRRPPVMSPLLKTPGSFPYAFIIRRMSPKANPEAEPPSPAAVPIGILGYKLKADRYLRNRYRIRVKMMLIRMQVPKGK